MPRLDRVRSRSARIGHLGVESLEGRALLSVAHPSFRIAPPAIVSNPASQHHPIHPLARTHGHKIGSTANLGTMTIRPASSPSRSGTPNATPASAPYTPAQVRHAYGFDQLALDGSGQTIAIVDAYDDPTISSDLATFSNQFGLPAANLIKAVPSTGTPSYDSGWAEEISLDVEWAHAIAPKATILLVEAKSSSFTDLYSAVDYAASSGAKQVSMSFGGGAFSGQTSYDFHFKHPGVTFLASSGDNGAGVEYPASSPYVTAVGGTSLTIDASTGNRIGEAAWSGSGGGTTTAEARPTYQSGFNTSRSRGVPDVSYNADPNTGFYVYDSSSGSGGWYQVGGTSAGAPQWAGLTALVNQGRAAAGKASIGTGTTYGTNQSLYALAGGTSYTNARGDYFDVVSGSNGYSAHSGYDLVTGLGSPIANKLVSDLIAS